MRDRTEPVPPDERLIVALDVAGRNDALRLVDDLGDAASFYKIGWRLFVRAGLDAILEDLKGHKVFLDLKLPDDIPETIAGTIVPIAASGAVRLMTLASGVSRATISAALAARGSAAGEAGGAATYPKLLSVPLLSSIGPSEFAALFGRPASEMPAFIMERARQVLEAGCDGLIASGDSIGALRQAHPGALIVSPGIRPAGSPAQDQKRTATPAQAITMGADYIVVGRPILNEPTPKRRKEAAKSIVEEIRQATA